jgi:hypothetical protein
VSGGTIDTSGLAAGEQGGQNVPYEESRTTAAVTQNEAYLAVEGGGQFAPPPPISIAPAQPIRNAPKPLSRPNSSEPDGVSLINI